MITLFKKYFKVTGLDISKNMIKIAKKINPNIKYMCSDMRELSLGTKYDTVIMVCDVNNGHEFSYAATAKFL